MNKKSIINLLLVALFAALISVSAYIKIMFIPPVPITLQTLFIVLVGLILPPSLSISSVLVYLLLGAIGLPVFTAGGGLGALLGPTGGYLIGSIPAVIVGSFMTKYLNKNNKLYLIIIIALIETALIYSVGLPWLSISRHLTVSQTLKGGLVPFIIGDTLKLIVASFAATTLRDRINQMLLKYEDEE